MVDRMKRTEITIIVLFVSTVISPFRFPEFMFLEDHAMKNKKTPK